MWWDPMWPLISTHPSCPASPSWGSVLLSLWWVVLCLQVWLLGSKSFVVKWLIICQVPYSCCLRQTGLYLPLGLPEPGDCSFSSPAHLGRLCLKLHPFAWWIPFLWSQWMTSLMPNSRDGMCGLSFLAWVLLEACNVLLSITWKSSSASQLGQDWATTMAYITALWSLVTRRCF